MVENMGAKLRTLRREKRITIVELAQQIGISQTYLSRLELGEIQPPQERVELIQSFLESLPAACR